MNNPVDFTPDLSAFKKEWLSLEQAVQRVAKFEHDFGKAHLSLACHAALASVLTPELVNLIRINFLENSVEWIAESDLLLSPLCFPIHQGIYEIEPQIRQVLLVVLQTDTGYGSERLEEVASLLYFYNESPLANYIPMHIKQLYQWISNAYLDPDVVVQNMVQFLENTDLGNSASRIANYQLVGKTLAMLANPLEMSNLQFELEDLADSTYLILHEYTGKVDFSLVLRDLAETSDGAIQPLMGSVVNWLLSSITVPSDDVAPQRSALDKKVIPIAAVKPTDIFCCYAHEDQGLLIRLKSHLLPLQREGLITLWSDMDLNAGDEWEKVLHQHLESASIILLLISTDFMLSDYCYGAEMQRAMQRHEEGSAHVVPILLRPTLINGTPFEKLQMLPTNAIPVTQWSSENMAFSDIATGIGRFIKQRQNIQDLPELPIPQRQTGDIHPIEVSCCYVPEDEAWLKKLEMYLNLLKRQGLLSRWHNRLLSPGTDWTQTIDPHLETASMILLLVSPDFLTSDYCYGIEMQSALAHRENGEVLVIPIILRPVDWQGAPFAHIQVLPTDSKPLTTWSNQDEGLVDIAAGIRRAIKEMALQRTIQPQFWNIPFARNPFFSGREDILSQLHEQLNTVQATVLSQVQALGGLGGIGKTQIALEYAYRYRQEYQAIFWARAESQEALISSYADIANLLNLPERNEQDSNILIRAVMNWLQMNQGWLLILDNADDLHILEAFLPPAGKGHILLTTRAHALGNLAQRISLNILSAEQGALLLLRRAGILPPTDSLEQAASNDQNLALQISRELEGLPLALDQAGAYIEKTACSLSEYLQIYHQQYTLLMKRRSIKTADYPASVATTWSLSFEKVEQSNPAAADLLRLSAFLAPDDIPEEIILKGTAYLEPSLALTATNASSLDTIMATLLTYSLVTRNGNTTTFSIHRLTQATLRGSMSRGETKVWSERAVHAVNEVFPEADFARWAECELYLQHALVCSHQIEQEQMILPEAAQLLHKAGIYLKERAQYTQAEPLLQQALSIRERGAGPKHPDTAFSLSSLALLYESQGRYAEAEPLLKRALSISEQQLKPEQLDTAFGLNNLAELYQAQGKYAEAEPLLKQALDIREQQLGPEHPETAASLNNLALLYNAQEKYAEAEPLLKRALIIREQQLGPEHPSTAASLDNLASLYDAQEKYAEAEVLYRRALDIRERQLGPEHPETAASLNNLASLYDTQEKYAEAEVLYRRALDIRERQLGPEHPETAASLNNLALLYDAQERYAEAELLLKRALVIREQRLGFEHSATIASINNLAHIYQEQMRYAEAEPLYQRVLAIREHQLGTKHVDTISSLNNLAQIYTEQSKYEQARILFQKSQDLLLEQMQSSEHISYVQGLKVLQQYAQGSSWESEFYLAQVCLLNNLYAEKTYGLSPQSMADRSQIIYDLNQLALTHLTVNFNDLCVANMSIESIIRSSSSETASHLEQSHQAQESRLSGKLVMIVDDSLTVRKIIETSLNREGIASISYADGITALQALSEKKHPAPDLIILDTDLPRMDGYEIARHLRAKQQFSNTIIIMLSTSNGLIDRLKGRSVGVKEYIIKPFRTQEIVSVIHSHLDVPKAP